MWREDCDLEHEVHALKDELDKFYVIVVLSNPCRYKARIDNYRKFKRGMENAGVNLITVECAFGERPFVITETENKNHIQLRTIEEIWLKENMINLAISRLPSTAKYIMWCDADIVFLRPDWAWEVIHELQHYQIVQCFETAIDLGPEGETYQINKSFMSQYIKGVPYPFGPNRKANSYGSYWHSGFCWAANKSALDMVGGLIDFCILGSADFKMANALIGKINVEIHTSDNSMYSTMIRSWANRAEKYIKRDVGYVKGTIAHFWHGKKKNRKYDSREHYLRKVGFNPITDLKRDHQGLWQLSDDRPDLRDGVREYNRQRNEDGIDF